MIFEIKDKSGRLVNLKEKQWNHILAEHPYMSGSLEPIQEALAFPDKIAESFNDEKVRFYYRYQKDSSKYLLVVVKYLNGKAFVIIAFYTKKIKK